MAKPAVSSQTGKNGSVPDTHADQEAEAHKPDLINRMAYAVFVIDAESLRFLDCNEAACHAYG